MKKIISLVLIVAMSLFIVACSDSGSDEKQEVKPQATQMRSICELATMQCYYHNVAKYYEKDADGILWWMKDRKFWVEYSGIVTIGIDTSLVTMKIDGDEVTITIPPAKVFGCKVDESTLTTDSFIVAQDSAPVEAKHQTEAFKQAQAKMCEAAENDTVLLSNAQERAKKLLEDYVTNIGNSIGKTYNITWVYIKDDADSDKTDSNESSYNSTTSEIGV